MRGSKIYLRLSALKSRRILAAGALISLSGLVLVAQQRPHVTGFFSDMHYVPEAGDLVGMEVWVISVGGDYFATVEIAEGVPTIPVVVPAEVSRSRLKFTIRESRTDQSGKALPDSVTVYEGVVTKAGFAGKFVNGQQFSLRRKSSYWQ